MSAAEFYMARRLAERQEQLAAIEERRIEAQDAAAQASGPLAALYSGAGNGGNYNIESNLSYPLELQSDSGGTGAINRFPHCMKISVFRPEQSNYNVQETNGTNAVTGTDPSIIETSTINQNRIPEFETGTAGFLNGLFNPSVAENNLENILIARGALSTLLDPGQDEGIIDKLKKALGRSIVRGTVGLGYATLIGGSLGTRVNVERKAKQLKQNIYLYIPDQVIAKHSHKYSDISATTALGDLGFLAQSGVDLKFDDELLNRLTQKSPASTELANRVVGAISDKLGLTGEGLQQLGLQATGYALNPQLEVLFDNTEFRTFQFSFEFLPRNITEAQQVMAIINNLRFYAAPELYNTRYFVPPYYFEIEYMMRNPTQDDEGNVSWGWQTNPYMPKITTCVLENIDVDYVGNSDRFVTYADGIPVSMKMVLNFKEIQIIHKGLIAKGGY